MRPLRPHYGDRVAELPRHTSQTTFVRGQRRREEILEAATELFAKDGYRGTGLAAIAAMVGVSQPTLLHHFGSKEGLMRAVLERRHVEDAQVSRAVLEAGGMRLLDFLPNYAAHLRERAGLAHLFAVLTAENLLPEHAAHDWFVERYRETRAACAQAFQTGVDRGEFRSDVDPQALAVRLVALLDGLQMQWLLDPSSIDLEAALKDAANALRVELVRDALPPA